MYHCCALWSGYSLRSAVSSIIISDPFGIFCLLLVHRAFDLALSTGYIFAGAYPVFLEVLFCFCFNSPCLAVTQLSDSPFSLAIHIPQVDKIAFRRPVDIGDLLRLKSRVIYSSANPHHTNTMHATATGTMECAESNHAGHVSPAQEGRPLLVVEVNCQVVRPER